MPVSDAMKANFIYKALAIRTWKDPELVDSAKAAFPTSAYRTRSRHCATS